MRHLPLRILPLISSLLILLVLCLPVQAQNTTPTPDPVMLQAQVDAQATQIAELSTTVGDVKTNVQQQNETWLRIGAIAATLGILSLVGFAWRLVKYAEQQTRKVIAKAVYAADPTNVIVHIPAQGFGLERQYLEARGFYQFRLYNQLDNTCLSDCVVVVARNDDAIETFRNFLKKHNPDPKTVAFVIYAPGGYRIPDDIPTLFHNMTYSNIAPTVATQLFTLAYRMVIPAVDQNRRE